MGEFLKNQYKGEDCLNKGDWTVCRLNGGKGGLAWKERKGVVFEKGEGEGLIPNAHYVISLKA